MSSLLSRRSLLRGLVAMPAVVAVGSLMPIRGVKFDPIMRVQSWPLGETPYGAWAAYEGPLSQIGEVHKKLHREYHAAYFDSLEAWRKTLKVDDQTLPNKPIIDDPNVGIKIPETAPVEYICRVGASPLPEERLTGMHFLSYQQTKHIPVEVLKAQLASICHWGV